MMYRVTKKNVILISVAKILSILILLLM